MAWTLCASALQGRLDLPKDKEPLLIMTAISMRCGWLNRWAAS
jgi:hypothetical protein